MNQRCTCEPVNVERRNGSITVLPGIIADGCPVRWETSVETQRRLYREARA